MKINIVTSQITLFEEVLVPLIKQKPAVWIDTI